MSQKRRHQESNSNRRWLMLGIGIVVVALVGGIAWSATRNDDTTASSALPEVTASDWTKGGAEDALVTIVEYSDLQCPSCAAYAPIIDGLVASYEGKVRLAYRHYPLPMHPYAIPAARAAEAAGAQGKFWEMVDVLFSRQDEWSKSRDAADLFAGYAAELGLDVASFKDDVQSGEVDRKIAEQRRAASGLGLRGTPSFFVNGELLTTLPPSEAAFREIIEAALAKASSTPTTASTTAQ